MLHYNLTRTILCADIQIQKCKHLFGGQLTALFQTFKIKTLLLTEMRCLTLDTLYFESF